MRPEGQARRQLDDPARCPLHRQKKQTTDTRIEQDCRKALPANPGAKGAKQACITFAQSLSTTIAAIEPRHACHGQKAGDRPNDLIEWNVQSP